MIILDLLFSNTINATRQAILFFVNIVFSYGIRLTPLFDPFQMFEVYVLNSVLESGDHMWSHIWQLLNDDFYLWKNAYICSYYISCVCYHIVRILNAREVTTNELQYSGTSYEGWGYKYIKYLWIECEILARSSSILLVVLPLVLPLIVPVLQWY